MSVKNSLTIYGYRYINKLLCCVVLDCYI